MTHTPRDLDKLHAEALERFKVTAAAEYSQRKRELEDLKFADPIEPSDQWPKDALDSRSGMPSSGTFPAVPARPALTINKLRQPIQLVQNQQRQARLSVQFAPEGGGASQDDAEAFEDIARAIQADSRAHLARNWAFDRAIKCGRGFYRIETDYVNDRSFDQKIVYKRIKNQFAVYFYPFCQEADFSDAEWCFITQDVPWKEYQRDFKDSDLAACTDEELTALGDSQPGWVDATESGRTIRIAEYYHFSHRADVLCAIRTDQGTQAILKSELGEGDDPALRVTGPDGKPLERPVQVRQLCWAKMNGLEFLKDGEEAEIVVERDGSYIPVIPIIADESNINGEQRYTGIVRPAIHAQRLFNVEASTLAESVHLAPLAPFIGYAEQFEGYTEFWAQLNVRRFPYLPVNATRDGSGSVLGLPERNTAEQPIQAITISLQHASSYIDATTGINPASLGQYDPSETSGRAVLARQKQSELATSGYLDNLASMSLLLEGKILRDLIPKVYDRPGRIVPAQGDDDERRTLILGQPFLPQKNGAAPQPVPPGTQGATVIDLKKGEFSVAATIGKSYTTKREEGVAAMSDLAQAAPPFVPAFADIWVKNMDFPGARQIGDRLARAVPPQFKDEQQGQNDPQALQQQLAHLQQVLQEMAPLADKNKADLMKAQITGQSDLQGKQFAESEETKRTQLKLAAQIEIARINAAKQSADLASEAAEERLALGVNIIHEQTQNELDRQHEAEMAQQQHQQALQQADQGHQQALEQGEQQVAGQSQLQAESAAQQPAESA